MKAYNKNYMKLNRHKNGLGISKAALEEDVDIYI
jgi:hypothetical protein